MNGNGHKLMINQSSGYCKASFWYKKQDVGKYGSAMVVILRRLKKSSILVDFPTILADFQIKLGKINDFLTSRKRTAMAEPYLPTSCFLYQNEP